MRPRLLESLEEHGLGVLSWLAPPPGAFYTVMVLALALLFLLRGRRAGLPGLRLVESALYTAVGAAIGTRLFYLVTTGALWRSAPLEWLDPSRGTASWGAYVGAAAGMSIYLGIVRAGPWSYLDVLASCAPLGTAIGRWSCFLAADDFGRVTSVPWALSFPVDSLPYRAHVAAGLIPAGASASAPVHPLQLYLLVNALLVFLVVSAIWWRWRDRPGLTLAFYLIIYGAARFPWEFLRDPAAGGATGLLSTSQWMCLTLVIAGIALLVWHQDASRGASRSALAELDRGGGSPT